MNTGRSKMSVLLYLSVKYGYHYHTFISIVVSFSQPDRPQLLVAKIIRLHVLPSYILILSCQNSVQGVPDAHFCLSSSQIVLFGSQTKSQLFRKTSPSYRSSTSTTHQSGFPIEGSSCVQQSFHTASRSLELHSKLLTRLDPSISILDRNRIVFSMTSGFV